MFAVTDLVQCRYSRDRGHVLRLERNDTWAVIRWLDGQIGRLPVTALRRIEVPADARAAA